MDDFSKAPGKANVYGLIGGKANAIFGGKTPLSSMSPTLVFDKKEYVWLLEPLAAHILLQLYCKGSYTRIDLNMHPLVSVARGRIHHQYQPHTVFIEEEALKEEEQNKLKAMGYVLKKAPSRAKLFIVERKALLLLGPPIREETAAPWAAQALSSMQKIKLISFKLCPFVQRTLIVLLEKKAEFTI